MSSIYNLVSFSILTHDQVLSLVANSVSTGLALTPNFNHSGSD